MPEPVKDRPTSSHEKLFLFAQQPRYFYDDVAVRANSDETELSQKSEPETLEGWDTEQPPGHVTAGNGSEATAAALRDVWSIPTAPFPGAHFATFPTRLVEPCIKAGTSSHGVCAVCGSPWTRITEISYVNPGGRETNGPRSLTQRHQTAGFSQRLERRSVHVGWEPGCGCDSERVPAVVLDPFGGSGTVAVVAHRLGRDAVLCELSQRYAEMAAARISGDAPMLNNTEITPTTADRSS